MLKRSGNPDLSGKNTILLFIFVIFLNSILFADYAITRGPDIGEIYFIGPTVTGEGIYRSTDFGETATCMDSTLNTNIGFMSICADLTPGVLYGFSMPENLYISYDYGQEGSWIFRNSNISYRLNSGVSEGFLYHGFSQHSEDFGFNFIQHSYNGFFGTSSISEIDINQNIGYVRSALEDSIYFFISYDNFENLEVQNVFNYFNEPIGLLTRGFDSGEIYSLGGLSAELRYSNDYGETWELKNNFNCPNLPIKGIVGGRQPGELFMNIEYFQLMGQIRHTYIYHSLDYGETFTVYHPFTYGPDPYITNFEAEPTTGTAPLTVQFTDLSSGANILGWEWDFENDGIIDSYEQNPEYTYQDTGSYSVRLLIDFGGFDFLIRRNYIHVTDGIGVDDHDLEIMNCKLNNHPNPFNPNTTIFYELPKRIERSNILIYNLKGKLIETLPIDKTKTSVNWEPVECSSGIYFYKLDVNGKSKAVKKCLLLK